VRSEASLAAVPATGRKLTRKPARSSFLHIERDPRLLDDQWRRCHTIHFRDRLADTDSFAAFVVDQPDGPDGEHLYRSLGFTEPAGTALTLRLR
jgi:hypothetical protein